MTAGLLRERLENDVASPAYSLLLAPKVALPVMDDDSCALETAQATAAAVAIGDQVRPRNTKLSTELLGVNLLLRTACHSCHSCHCPPAQGSPNSQGLLHAISSSFFTSSNGKRQRAENELQLASSELGRTSRLHHVHVG
jgi:hypothetical protein